MISPRLSLRQVLPDAIVIAIVIAARFTGALQFLELTLLDTLLRLRPAEPTDERIVIVGISEADIQRAKTYPIPDRQIAQLIQQLKVAQPAVIGLDIFRDLPVEPGHAELVKTFQTTPNLIAIAKVLSDRSGAIVKPPSGIPPEQVGFVDALVDSDGKLRRSLLGTATDQGDYQLSLSIRLAAAYLKKTANLTLENGIRDREAMRLGTVELPRLQSDSGGYARVDAGGNQTLINFRSGKHPFPVLTLDDIQKGVDPARLRGKIVLIGVMAPSIKDTVNTSAIAAENSTSIYGIEAQAHVVSQIISAVLDGRPLLTTWTSGWDCLWIVFWGVLGLILGRFIASPAISLFAVTIASLGLILGSYGMLLLGWWIPILPALLVVVLNGVGIAAFHRYDAALRSRIRDRQITIDHTFNTIHNGPLQTLAQLLRAVQDDELSRSQILDKLNYLNRELRDVYERVQREALLPAEQLYIGQNQALDLQVPLHEVLQEVYNTVLTRDFPGFTTIKLKIVTFEPLNERYLNPDQKRGICRFWEEALCNVGKHAIAPTRLEILCTQAQDKNILRVTDNGTGVTAPASALQHPNPGMGTQQATRLARQLAGTFQRQPNQPHGMICELIWSTNPRPFWRFWS